MKRKDRLHGGRVVLIAAGMLMCSIATSQAADKKPNILFIMGDDGGGLPPDAGTGHVQS